MAVTTKEIFKGKEGLSWLVAGGSLYFYAREIPNFYSGTAPG